MGWVSSKSNGANPPRAEWITIMPHMEILPCDLSERGGGGRERAGGSRREGECGGERRREGERERESV